MYTLIGASSPLAVDFSALNEVLWLVDLFSILFFFLILICLRKCLFFLKPLPNKFKHSCRKKKEKSFIADRFQLLYDTTPALNKALQLSLSIFSMTSAEIAILSAISHSPPSQVLLYDQTLNFLLSRLWFNSIIKAHEEKPTLDIGGGGRDRISFETTAV